MTVRTRTRAAAVALLTLALVAGDSRPAAAADADLTVDKLTLRVPTPRGDRAPNHRIKLKAHLEQSPALAAFDAAVDDVRVTVGGFEVFALPAAGARDSLREAKALQWRYRGARRDGRPRLKLDLGLLKLTLKAKGLDLTALTEGDTTDVEVALHLGDTAWSGSVDLGRSGNRLKLVPREPGTEPPREDPPSEDPPSDPGTRDGPLTLTPVATGQYSTIQRPETVVVRSAPEWSTLWRRHGDRGPEPRVDFATEMVVAVFLGQRPDPAYSTAIDSASARGDDVDVAYTETIVTNGVFPTVVTTPFAMVRIARRTGRVTFTGRIVRTR